MALTRRDVLTAGAAGAAAALGLGAAGAPGAHAAAGRAGVQQGSVSALPFPTGTFDLVTAVETHYYWPDLPSDLLEVRRVLKPGGRLLLIAEAYRGSRADWLFAPAMRALGAKYLTAAEHRRLLEGAGYADVEVHEQRSKGWLCAVGRKEAAD